MTRTPSRRLRAANAPSACTSPHRATGAAPRAAIYVRAPDERRRVACCRRAIETDGALLTSIHVDRARDRRALTDLLAAATARSFDVVYYDGPAHITAPIVLTLAVMGIGFRTVPTPLTVLASSLFLSAQRKVTAHHPAILASYARYSIDDGAGTIDDVDPAGLEASLPGRALACLGSDAGVPKRLRRRPLAAMRAAAHARGARLVAVRRQGDGSSDGAALGSLVEGCAARGEIDVVLVDRDALERGGFAPAGSAIAAAVFARRMRSHGVPIVDAGGTALSAADLRAAGLAIDVACGGLG